MIYILTKPDLEKIPINYFYSNNDNNRNNIDDNGSYLRVLIAWAKTFTTAKLNFHELVSGWSEIDNISNKHGWVQPQDL